MRPLPDRNATGDDPGCQLRSTWARLFLLAGDILSDMLDSRGRSVAVPLRVLWECKPPYAAVNTIQVVHGRCSQLYARTTIMEEARDWHSVTDAEIHTQP